jgi:PAS domain S-box-containing protein
VLLAPLRQVSQTRGIPVVVVTAPQPIVLLAAITAGVTAAIPAQDHPDAVLQLVGILIDQTRDRESADDQRVLLTALLENAHPDRYLDQAVRHRAEALLARLIDSRVAILVANNGARYVEANGIACSLTGYSRVELLTKSVWDVTPTPSRETGRALWRQFLANGLFDGPYTITRKDGGLLSVHAVAVANVVPGLHVSGLALMPPSPRAGARATA